MRASMLVGRFVGAALLSVSATAGAQTAGAGGQPPPASRVSMEDAVRLALERNHQLRAQRLNVDISKADEITAALKPNPLLTSTNENFPIFSPGELFSSGNFLNNQNFVENLSYLFERGGKRKSRTGSRKTPPPSRTARHWTRNVSWCSGPVRHSSMSCWLSQR